MEAYCDKATVGKIVWIPKLGPDMWERAEVLTNADKKGKYFVETLQDKVADHTKQVYLENPQTVEDMTSLWYIHEPGILINLEKRSLKDRAYTFMGPVLVAVNPLKPLKNPKIDYSVEQSIQSVATKPHPFAIAEVAYQQMCFAMQQIQYQEKLTSWGGAPRRNHRKEKNSSKRTNDGMFDAVVVNQSIVIGGESGAGKTESSKLVLRHLVSRCGGAGTISESLQHHTKREKPSGRKPKHGQSEDLDQKLLNTNPILEAFGNSVTLRNHNSSRFGKFMKLHFSQDENKSGVYCKIVGATIQSYLLERSRVTWHAPGERGFHVFYQLVKGATKSQRKQFGIMDIKPSSFQYLSPRTSTVSPNESSNSRNNTRRPSLARRLSRVAGSATNLAHGIGGSFKGVGEPATVKVTKKSDKSDVEDFKQLCHALESVGISTTDIDLLLGSVAGILHLGNVNFNNDEESTTGDKATVKRNSDSWKHLECAARLLGCTSNGLLKLLTERPVVAGTERMTAVRSALQASFARDALAKAVYNALFDWIIRAINLSLIVSNITPTTREQKRQTRVKPSRTTDSSQEESSEINGIESEPFVGVLDIFGFESFIRNDLEQLLINFTNEALQQTFNEQVFQAELELYRKEGLTLATNDKLAKPPENRMCMELLAGSSGILEVISNQGRIPQASDSKMLKALQLQFDTKNKHFVKVHPRDAQHCFAIDHYAGLVTYTVGGFLQKNNDTLPKEVNELLATSSNKILMQHFTSFVATKEPTSNGGKRNKQTKTSIVSNFKLQISDLTATLGTTKCSFIRCIKPNPQMVRESRKDDWFERRYVTAQLKSLSIPQTAQVLRTGLPTRISYAALAGSYMGILPRDATKAWRVLGGNNEKALVSAMFWAFGIPREDYKLGLTKVFFKSGKLGQLDHVLKAGNEWTGSNSKTKEKKAIIKRIRLYFARRRWRILFSVILSRNAFVTLFKQVSSSTEAIVKIQSWLRGVGLQRQYTQLRSGVITIQAIYRGGALRTKFAKDMQAVEEKLAREKKQAKKARQKLEQKKERIEKHRRVKAEQLKKIKLQIDEEEEKVRREAMGNESDIDTVPAFAPMRGKLAKSMGKQSDDEKMKRKNVRKSVRQLELEKEFSQISREFKEEEEQEILVEDQVEKLKKKQKELEYTLLVAHKVNQQEKTKSSREKQNREHRTQIALDKSREKRYRDAARRESKHNAVEADRKHTVRLLAEGVERQEARQKLAEETSMPGMRLSRRASVRELAHSMVSVLQSGNNPSNKATTKSALSPKLRTVQTVGTVKFEAMKLAVKSKSNWKKRVFHLTVATRSIGYYRARGNGKLRGVFTFNPVGAASQPPKVSFHRGYLKGKPFVVVLSGGRSPKFPNVTNLSLCLSFSTPAEREDFYKAAQFVAFGEVVDDVKRLTREIDGNVMDVDDPNIALNSLLKDDEDSLEALATMDKLKKQGRITQYAYERLIQSVIPTRLWKRKNKRDSDDELEQDSEFGVQMICSKCHNSSNTKLTKNCSVCAHELLLELAKQGSYKPPYAVDVEW